MSDDRFYLKCPFDEKDECKSLGGRWDNDARKWYVPKEVQPLHGRQRIVLALNTRSRAKALKHPQVICQRLDERWLPMRLDAMGLGAAILDI